MERSIKHLYGEKIGALDGEIGHVKDFYFDDQSWIVRYLVVETFTWLTGRMVLLAPNAFVNFDEDGVSRGVNLTRQQIADSPALATHKPVSRQFQEEYYLYYGWPDYWNGDGLSGLSTIYNPEPTSKDHSSPPLHRDVPSPQSPDAHLRSTQALNNYHIETSEGPIGHVTDFIVDGKIWAITHVVIETGQWLCSKEIVISPKQIERISYTESKIFVSVTKDDILNGAHFHLAPWVFNGSPLSTVDL